MQIDRKATIPLRVSLNVLYYTPKPELSVTNLTQLLPRQPYNCSSCSRLARVAAVAPATTASDTEDDSVPSAADCSQVKRPSLLPVSNSLPANFMAEDELPDSPVSAVGETDS